MTPVDRIPVLKKTGRAARITGRRRRGRRGHQPADRDGLGTAAPPLRAAVRRATGPGPRRCGLLATLCAEGGRDLCYVKDVARGIALLQAAEHLTHCTYNVAAGHVTSNAEIVAAITHALSHAHVDLLPGRDPADPGQDTHLDITRIHHDTGYQLHYDLARGVTDYIEWLRAGHEY
jgi:UDP-glucose 4-epimerase